MGDQVNSGGNWVGVRDLAQIKNVSAPAISKRLKKFEDQGLIEVRHEGGKKLVNIAHWDVVTKENTDPAKVVGRQTATIGQGVRDEDDDLSSETSKAYRVDQARKMKYEADRREIEVAEQVGQLVRLEDVKIAMELAAEKIVQQIDQLPSYADELAGAVSRGGSVALKESLKTHTRRLRKLVADAMTLQHKDDDE